MGDTLLVAAAKHQADEGIVGLVRSLYLYPSDGDSWIIDMSWIGGRSESPPILEATICDEVRRVVATDESYDAACRLWRFADG